MLKVLPIQSKEEQEILCGRCGIKFDPDLLAYVASVDGETVGVCQFKLNSEGGFIHDIATLLDREETADKASRDASDFEALFVLGRGALNFIDLCGAHSVKASAETTDETLLRARGFKKQDSGEYFCDMDGMFDGKHCSGHAVDLDALK